MWASQGTWSEGQIGVARQAWRNRHPRRRKQKTQVSEEQKWWKERIELKGREEQTKFEFLLWKNEKPFVRVQLLIARNPNTDCSVMILIGLLCSSHHSLSWSQLWADPMKGRTAGVPGYVWDRNCCLSSQFCKLSDKAKPHLARLSQPGILW